MPRYRPTAKLDIPRLCEAVRADRLALRPFRENRLTAVRQRAGRNYSDNGTWESVPVNFVGLYEQVVSRSLIAKNPRVMLSTFEREFKPQVSIMQEWANGEVEQIRLATTLQRAVVDALYVMGIARVALASPADASRKGWNLSAGQPVVDWIDLDDWVWDMHARCADEVRYSGHRYRVDIDVLKDSKIYNSKARQLLVPDSTDQPYNQDGDERIKRLGQQYYDGTEYRDGVTVWELYDPLLRRIVTIAESQMGDSNVEPLREVEWLGPDNGPYFPLSYGLIAGNLMPQGPILGILDLHLAANNEFRKLIRQAERLKQVTLIQGGADKDGNRIQQCNDGDVLMVDDPANISQFATTGPNQQLMGHFATMFTMFNIFAGNLQAQAGLDTQSRTASQDKMLEANAQKAVADMQDITVTWVSDVLESLCWFYWHHPQLRMRTEHKLQTMPEMSQPRVLESKDRRKAKWDDLKVKVDPYSMQHQTPQSRAAQLDGVFNQILPIMPLIQQQGIVVDINAYLQKKAAYLDMPDLGEIVSIQEPLPPDSGTGGAEMAKPKGPETTRNYVRENVSARSNQGTLTALADGMGEGSLQPSEAGFAPVGG